MTTQDPSPLGRGAVAAPYDAQSVAAFDAPIAAQQADASDPLLARPYPEIPKYRIEGVEGRGGLGVVYRAQELDPTRAVAIKVIRPSLSLDPSLAPESLRLFRREIDAAGKLHHPYIQSIYTSGTFQWGDRELPYFVMALTPARSLGAFIVETKPPHRQRLELLIKIVRAVAYAHLNDVVHRDLSDSNVVVREDGLPVIRDFSIARHLTIHEDDGTSASNGTGNVSGPRGTLRYIAPEVLAREGNADHRVDIYSLGVLCYEALVERSPYLTADNSEESLKLAIRTGSLDWSPRVTRVLGADLTSILQKALARNPDHRYATAEGLAGDLECIVADVAPTVAATSRSAELGRLWRRHGTAFITIVVLMAVLVAGIGATIWQASRATQRADRLAQFATAVAHELASNVEYRPRTASDRFALFERGVEILRAAARDSGDDPRLNQALAIALVELSRTAGDPSRANLGRPEDAVVLAHEAAELLERDPAWDSNLEAQQYWARCHLTAGDAVFAIDPQRASISYAKSHARYLAILEKHPGEQDVRLLTAHVLARLASGRAAATLNPPVTELAATRAAVETSLHVSPPTTDSQRFEDADVFEALARTAVLVEDFEEATALARRSLSYLHQSADQTGPEAAGRLLNPLRIEADIRRARGDDQGETALRRHIAEMIAAHREVSPEHYGLSAADVFLAEAYAACTLRTRLDADHATATFVRAARVRFANDETDARRRADLAKALRWRMLFLESFEHDLEYAQDEIAELDRELLDLDVAAKNAD